MQEIEELSRQMAALSDEQDRLCTSFRNPPLRPSDLMMESVCSSETLVNLY
jgi:hypothetical protein